MRGIVGVGVSVKADLRAMATGKNLLVIRLQGEVNLPVLTDVESESDGSWQDQSTDEFDEDDELHAKAEGTTEISDKDQFHEIVHGRIDPSAALRE